MILHLSDLHFGTEKPECIRAIQKFCQQRRPEAVVVSGDLTLNTTDNGIVSRGCQPGTTSRAFNLKQTYYYVNTDYQRTHPHPSGLVEGW